MKKKDNWISNFKKKVDNINFFFTTTAGHATVAVAMCIVQLFSTSSYFVDIIHSGKKWMFKEGNAGSEVEAMTYVIGLLFAFSLEFGIYFTAINGRERISSLFAFISSILGFISFKGLLLKENLDKTTGFVSYTTPNFESLDFYFTLLGVLILSFFPAFFIADVSSQMRRLYTEEGLSPKEEEPPYIKTEAFNNMKEYNDLIKNLN